jgi:hypothetical protein
MKRQQYEEMKIYLGEIRALLQKGDLSPEEREKLEELSQQLAGALLHPWLPVGWELRLIVLVHFCPVKL